MGRKRNELTKHLRLPPVPMPDETRKKETFETALVLLERARSEELSERSPILDFFVRQGRFIGWKTWLGHVALLLAAALLAVRIPPASINDNWQLLAVLSTVSPLLALIGIRMLARSYVYRMAELEMSTYYSLEQLFLSRLCLFAIADFTGLAGLAGCLSLTWGQQLGHLLLYLFTPFTVSAAGCLWLFNQSRIRDKASACSIFTMLLVAFQIASAFRSPAGDGLYELVYGAPTHGVWLSVFVLSTLMFAVQVRRMLRACRRPEAGTM